MWNPEKVESNREFPHGDAKTAASIDMALPVRCSQSLSCLLASRDRISTGLGTVLLKWKILISSILELFFKTANSPILMLKNDFFGTSPSPPPPPKKKKTLFKKLKNIGCGWRRWSGWSSTISSWQETVNYPELQALNVRLASKPMLGNNTLSDCGNKRFRGNLNLFRAQSPQIGFQGADSTICAGSVVSKSSSWGTAVCTARRISDNSKLHHLKLEHVP